MIVITTGDHGRTTQVPAGEQYAHQYMPSDADGPNPEGHEHQAWNFITYAKALGGSKKPYVLLAPEVPEDDAERDHLWIEMMDWAAIVETATGTPVKMP